MTDPVGAWAAAGTVLARTSATEVVPGANLVESAAGSCVLSALPILDLGRIGVVGRSTPATLASLATRGALVDLATDERQTVDVVWLGEHPGALAPHDPRLADVVARLAVGGLVVGEVRAGRSRSDLRRLRRDLARVGLETELILWARPRTGPIRAMVPAGDSMTIHYMIVRGLAVSLYRVRAKHRIPALAILERRLASSLTAERAGHRLAFVARRRPDGPVRAADADDPSPAPPSWLSAAVAADVDLSGHRWALTSPGKYLSQKEIWYLLAPGATKPEFVVKVTRDPSYNTRLDNEIAALRFVATIDLGAKIRVPRPVASGRAGDVAIAVESVVRGEPFATKARPRPEDPDLALAVDWLVRMGAATRTSVAAARLGEALAGSVARCASVYALTPRERAFLDQQVERVVSVGCPTVVMHGDPGTWNLLLASDGTLGVLDWEAAERDGLPFWDLFHLLRSYAVLASSRWLPHRSFRLARRHLVEGSNLTGTFAAAVESYRAALGLSREIVEPLYHLGFVHRAMKEASRLAPTRLDSGHYIRLLRAGMPDRRRPGLDRILGTHAVSRG